MVEDTIHFEQKNILREISSGLDLTNVRSWFQHVESETTIQAPQSPESRLSAFTYRTIDLIVDGCGSVPPTFRYDVDRIAILQIELDLFCKQLLCGRVFVKTLEALGSFGLPPEHSLKNLLCRISAFAEFPQFNYGQLPVVTNIALEIVRAAYQCTGNESLPRETLVEATAKLLVHAWDEETDEFQEVRSMLRECLRKSVSQEMAAVMDKTPLQTLNHFDPVLARRPSMVPYDPSQGAQIEHDNLPNIAMRIAHIAALHWKVWAPMLYEQPCRASAVTHSLDISPDGEMDLAPAADMLMSEQGSRNNIFKSESAKSDGNSSDECQSSPV